MARGVINFSSKKKLYSATSKKKLVRIPISLLSATRASNKALIPSLTSWNPSGVSGALLAHPKLGQVLVRLRPGVIEFFCTSAGAYQQKRSVHFSARNLLSKSLH